jgi:hypothetical protein
MSLAAFKKKSVIQYGSKRSGKPPGGYWLPQGPFGHSTTGLQLAIENYGPVGFSLNGPHRNVGYVGKGYSMSKNGTPYRGTQPLGCGGHLGNYATPEPVFNVNRVIVEGDQWLYVKPTVLTTAGMLEKKYKWVKNGVYPNNWVQPNYTGMLTDTKSQGMYLHELSAANICVLDVNNVDRYRGFIKRMGPTLCRTSTARFKYNDMARNGPYTKRIKQPETSSEHTLRIQRRCANPIGAQKPFPYGVQTGTGIQSGGGLNITSVGNACNTSNTYTVPPEWYIQSPSGIN